MSFLCDITDQVPIPGMEADVLRMSKIGRGEAQRMLVDVADALGLEWGAFLHDLAEAWRVRRDAKATRLGWFAEEERWLPRLTAPPRPRPRRSSASRPVGEYSVQLFLF